MKGKAILIISFLLISSLGSLFLTNFGEMAKADDSNWWDSDWTNRMLITINHDFIDAELTNFPIKVTFTANETLYDNILANGTDIAFIDYEDNSSELYYELEHFSREIWVTGVVNLTAWVQVPTVEDLSDTKIWIYWGNSGAAAHADTWDENTWDANYMAVYHMNGSDPYFWDSTNHNLHLLKWERGTAGAGLNVTGFGSPIFAESAWFSAGADSDSAGFLAGRDNESDFMSYANLTVESWSNLTSAQTTKHRAIAGFEEYGDSGPGWTDWGERIGGDPDPVWTLVLRTTEMDTSCYLNDTLLNFSVDTVSTSWDFVLSSDVWRYKAWSVGEADGVMGYQDVPFYIGAAQIHSGQPENFYNGWIDEVRISYTNRSAAWITASFHSSNSSVNFLTFGPSDTKTPEAGSFTCTAGSEIGNWNISLPIEAATFPSSTVYPWRGNWSVSDDSADWAGNWTLKVTNAPYNNLSYAFMNFSCTNRSQSLVWTRVNDTFCNYSFAFPGVIYAAKDDGNFSMALYGEEELFLLDYNDTILYNTLDHEAGAVTNYSDAINYLNLWWGWSPDYEEEQEGYWVDNFDPFNISGAWIKTTYNSLAGHLNTKYWGTPGEYPVETLGLMQEPVGWTYDGDVTNITSSDPRCHGLAAWMPEDYTSDEDEWIVHFDSYNLWRLNYTVNESASDWWNYPDSYRPLMNFPIIDAGEAHDWVWETFNATGPGNMTVDDVTLMLVEATNNISYESRYYPAGNHKTDLKAWPMGDGNFSMPTWTDFNETVHYYSCLFTNATEAFGNDTYPNSLLAFYIQASFDGDCEDTDTSADHIFIGIDVDNDYSWDDNDRAYMALASGATYSWTGNSADVITDFYHHSWETNRTAYLNFHRYNQQMNYIVLLPLYGLIKEDSTPLNTTDSFGLHISIINDDDWDYVCDWATWDETAQKSDFDDAYDEIYGVTTNCSAGPYPAEDLTINSTSITYWGEGKIGSGVVNGTLGDVAYGLTKAVSHTDLPWQFNFTVTVTNLGTDTLTNVTLNETFDSDLTLNTTYGVAYQDGDTFYVAPAGGIPSMGTHVASFIFNIINGTNGSTYTNNVTSDQSTPAGGNPAYGEATGELSWCVTKTHNATVDWNSTWIWYNITVRNTGDCLINGSAYENVGPYQNWNIDTYGNNGTGYDGDYVQNVSVRNWSIYPWEIEWWNLTFATSAHIPLTNGTYLYNNATVNATEGTGYPPTGIPPDINTTVNERTIIGALTSRICITYTTPGFSINALLVPLLVIAVMTVIVIIGVVYMVHLKKME